MEDWTKILLSAGTGFAFGIAAEPLKMLFNDWWQRRNLSRALNRELASNIATLVNYYRSRQCIAGYTLAQYLAEFSGPSTQVMTYAKSKPELLFRLNKFHDFDYAYDILLDMERNADGFSAEFAWGLCTHHLLHHVVKDKARLAALLKELSLLERAIVNKAVAGYISKTDMLLMPEGASLHTNRFFPTIGFMTEGGNTRPHQSSEE